ncbi:MAG TPA: glycosyltransferase family 39 protein [Candidatus Acidoferrales bacterium]|nr:glycosyltransferase family 39 protein [Candidatus Acidoferrales bacterium]
MRNLLREKARFFLGAGLAALALRLVFVLRFPGVVDDSRLYANIAENWLRHGIYGITDSGQIIPTLSRLPGYPAFLAAIFSIFGIGNFRAVLLVQVVFDLATCLLIADLARRFFGARAAQAAFLLAGLCPFLADYAAAALTETLEIFFTALALDLACRGLGVGADRPIQWPHLVWLGCGLAVGAAILLRPDGGILLATIAGYLIYRLARSVWAGQSTSPVDRRAWLGAIVLVIVGVAVPLIPWTLRNLHTLHRFEPLAPRYANDSDELVMKGFNRWVKTWIADYVSVQEIYWNVPGDAIDVSRLPRRAFDSEQQRKVTAELFADYNVDHDMTPELDARFAALAAERIQAAPVRYYVRLPALRVADMWLRPRTELLASDPRWWEFNDEAAWLAVSIAFGVINLLYVMLAGIGLFRGGGMTGVGLLILFVVLRSAFLGTLENPEPRYTLECYPALIVVASACFVELSQRQMFR